MAETRFPTIAFPTATATARPDLEGVALGAQAANSVRAAFAMLLLLVLGFLLEEVITILNGRGNDRRKRGSGRG